MQDVLVGGCSKLVVYLALAVTLSAIFQTPAPAAGRHFFASASDICDVCARPKNPEKR